MKHLTEPERELLAAQLASHTAPMLTYAVAAGDKHLVSQTLTGLDEQDLTALCIVLAAEHPAPLTRPADGIVDKVAVDRFVGGEIVPLSRPEKVLAAHLLFGRDVVVLQIARRLMVSCETVRRMLSQAPPQPTEPELLGEDPEVGEQLPYGQLVVGEGEKWCPDCQQVRATTEFNVDRSRKDKLFRKCKHCRSDDRPVQGQPAREAAA